MFASFNGARQNLARAFSNHAAEVEAGNPLLLDDLEDLRQAIVALFCMSSDKIEKADDLTDEIDAVLHDLGTERGEE